MAVSEYIMHQQCHSNYKSLISRPLSLTFVTRVSIVVSCLRSLPNTIAISLSSVRSGSMPLILWSNRNVNYYVLQLYTDPRLLFKGYYTNEASFIHLQSIFLSWRRVNLIGSWDLNYWNWFCYRKVRFGESDDFVPMLSLVWNNLSLSILLQICSRVAQR